MASTIQLKTGTGNAVPSSLTQGEVGINVDNGLIYFGSGSGNKVKKLETFLNITASISGGIGGNISASGNIIGDHFIGQEGFRLIENNNSTVTVGFQNNTPIVIGKSANPTKFEGHITASGNISASGNILTSGDLDVLGEIECDHLNIADVDDGIHFGDTQVLFVDGDNNVNFGVDGNSAVDLELYGHNHTYTAGGSITLDAGGDITLDAAGDNIRFKDAGTTTADLNTNTGKFTTIGDISSSGDITARLNDNTGFILGSLNALSGDANNILYLGNNNTWEKIIYGRQTTDQHLFNGVITASNDISSSGQIFAAKVLVGGGPLLTNLNGDLKSSTGFFGTNITASNDISASGTITTPSLLTNNITGIGDSDTFISLGVSANRTDFTNGGSVLVRLDSGNASPIILNNATQVSGILDVTDTTDSTDASGDTGAVRIEGGVSIAKKAFIGTELNVPHRHFDTGSSTLGSNGGSIGDIVKFGGSTTTAGKIYNLKQDGTWDETNVTASLNQGASTGSLAVALGSNSTTNGMLLRGMAHLASDPEAGVGQPVFLSTESGSAQSYAPTGSGEIVRIIGHQMSGSGIVYFNPSPDFIEVS